MFHDMCTFMEHQVPREGDVVNWGKDFLVGYHIVDPFHQPDHVPDPRHKIIDIIGHCEKMVKLSVLNKSFVTFSVLGEFF